jgi:hypothetical protein
VASSDNHQHIDWRSESSMKAWPVADRRARHPQVLEARDYRRMIQLAPPGAHPNLILDRGLGLLLGVKRE